MVEMQGDILKSIHHQINVDYLDTQIDTNQRDSYHLSGSCHPRLYMQWRVATE